MSVSHSFSVEVACVVGDRRATILNNFSHWHLKNGADGHHVFDGHVWTYNSIAAFAKVWPYLTIKQVRLCLDSLVDEGYLITGNYNEWKTDQTKWYALTEKACELLKIPFSVELSHLPKRANGLAQKGKSNSQEGQMELPETADGVAQNGKPIPLIKPIENQLENTTTTTEEVVDAAAEIERLLFEDVRKKIEEKRTSVLSGLIIKKQDCATFDITEEFYDKLANAFFNEQIGMAQMGENIIIKDLRKHFRNWLRTQVQLGHQSRFHPQFKPVAPVTSAYPVRQEPPTNQITAKFKSVLPD